MKKTIAQRVQFIRQVRDEHGLSAEKICDIVSLHGGYVSVATVRRVIAKDAETKRFRIDTVEPIYDALAAEYEDSTPASGADSDLPSFLYSHYDRHQYERHIAMLTERIAGLLTENAELKAQNEKQGKVIDILWHGLQVEDDHEAVSDFYKKQ